MTLRRRIRPLLFFCIVCLFAGIAAAKKQETRWEPEIKAFEQADKNSPPPGGGIVFTGSSTIRKWTTLSQDFSKEQVLNRGFGGCEIADCTRYADRIVVPYKPKLVILRAGGNDINAGKTPEQVCDDFKEFVEKVRAKLPGVPIAYMTINATPARLGNMQREQKANELIKTYIAHGGKLDYIDTTKLFDDEQGKPRNKFFVADRLHFNASGYELLAKRVNEYLRQKEHDKTSSNEAAPGSQP